jgi:hypothetical protein
MLLMTPNIGAVAQAVLFSDAVASGQSSPTPTVFDQMLYPSPNPPVNNGEFFGHAVAISGDTIVVGAPMTGTIAANGKAYVFTHDGQVWVKTKVLTASNQTSDALFGSSVAISGDSLVVGARCGNNPNPISRTGTANVFERQGNDWFETEFLRPPDGSAWDQFGSSVAVSGQIVVVGAPYNGTCGAAYVFEETAGNWLWSDTLVPADCSAGQWFGSALAVIDGDAYDLIAVGANGDDELGNNAGALYVFLRFDDTWLDTPKALADDGAAGDSLGSCIAIDEVTVAAGAPGDDDQGSGAGSVYLFESLFFTWTQSHEIHATEVDALDGFGASVALEPDVLITGAPGAMGVGTAYLFEQYNNMWYQSMRVTNAVLGGGDSFGNGVGVSQGVFVAGAPMDDDVKPDAGSARVFAGLSLIFADGFESGDTSAWSSTQ